MKLKKGFLFSLFVITALSLIVFTVTSRVKFKEEQRAESFNQRVKYTNFFVEDMKKDVERSLYVASFRAFLAAEEYILANEDYLDKNAFNKTMESLILNGTMNGTTMNATNSSTFMNWTKKIGKLARRFKININFTDMNIRVMQNNPWHISVSLYSNVSIIDNEKELGWNFELKKSTSIDIREANFMDPIYYVESIKNYQQNKNKVLSRKPLLNYYEETIYPSLWQNQSGFINVSNLEKHTTEQLYNKSRSAPSYLMRLQGETDCTQPEYFSVCDKYGIESFVNVINHTYENIWDFSHSGQKTCIVDYQFFVEGCDPITKKGYNLINMPTDFIIDWPAMQNYNLTALNKSVAVS
ncbi:hypothetical protein GF323_00860 [Candidatus Woesearchaeota archaeon]|nr:hypothetical protein [Candidatus Woesearchaeota archaeon]